MQFWASINDVTRTPSFHIAVSWSMPSSCPQPMAFIAVIPNRLELGFIMATRGTKMMIEEIDSSTFALITFIIRGKSAKMKVSQNLLEESRKRPGLGERDSSNFSALHEKIPHTTGRPPSASGGRC